MRLSAGAVAFAFVVGISAPSFAEVKTVKGEIADSACYKKDSGNKGEAHKDCGTSCVKKGGPVALITASGDVYMITGSYTENKNAKLVEHVAHTVEVTGDVSEKDGQKMIAVTSLKMAS
jgi:hypothetical protein